MISRTFLSERGRWGVYLAIFRTLAGILFDCQESHILMMLAHGESGFCDPREMDQIFSIRTSFDWLALLHLGMDHDFRHQKRVPTQRAGFHSSPVGFGIRVRSQSHPALDEWGHLNT